MSQSYTNELEFAKSLAVEAGTIMRENFMDGSAREWKSDATPVTLTDTAINSIVIERISAKFPDHSVLGEEESHNLGQEYVWVCDPVDGTLPFSHGVPVSTFSLALTHNGESIVGVVYDPFMNRLFYAARGQGAFMNDAPIHVSTNGMQNAVIDIAGFPSAHPVIDAAGEFLTDLASLGAHVTSLWSVILPSSLVAAGEYTATIFNLDKPEDGAAIKVIVEEAGGKVTDLFGDEQRADAPVKGFIASNGVVHQQIVDVLAKYKS